VTHLEDGTAQRARHAVAAARRCTSVVVARLVTRRSHIVVVARRQARRHRAVRTLRAVVPALALPSATLPRARRTVASPGRAGRARLACLRLIHRRQVSSAGRSAPCFQGGAPI